MKFTLFAFIAGLCLLAVSANVGAFVQPQSVELEYFAEDFADAVDTGDDFSVFGPMYFVIKAALRTLKGINCTIKGVLDMRNAAQQLIDDVNACGVQVSKQLQSVISACQAVISTSNDIINYSDNVCHIDDYNPETDANKKTPFSCAFKLLHKMLTLKKQISKTISLVKKVPAAGASAGDCVVTALTTLTSTFIQFPTFVKDCSKLTS